MGLEFEQLVRELSPSLFRLALSYTGSREDAEDAVQEVFLKYLRGGRRFDSPEEARRYLMTATANQCRDLLKSAARRRNRALEEAERCAAPAADPDTRLEVQRALQALDPKYRGVVYLFYYEDYPVKRIAQCLGLTQTTVRTRLDRARKQLKQLLGGEDRG